MTRRIFIVADDYGLSPAVQDAIIDLISAGRLSGTSCMTGFPDWPSAASRLRPLAGRAGLGLHLTLTDQNAVTGVSGLAPRGRLPPLRTLALMQLAGRLDAALVHAELDAQHARFVEGIGVEPVFVDGHQHVHFLPVVRHWLLARFAGVPHAERPALRGAPSLALRSPKVAAVALMAAGFEQAMRAAGFRIIGPLCGFYDWTTPARFEGALRQAIAGLADGGLFMCHPGGVDATLRSRDRLLEARAVEHEVLGSGRVETWLADADARIATFPQ